MAWLAGMCIDQKARLPGLRIDKKSRLARLHVGKRSSLCLDWLASLRIGHWAIRLARLLRERHYGLGRRRGGLRASLRRRSRGGVYAQYPRRNQEIGRERQTMVLGAHVRN